MKSTALNLVAVAVLLAVLGVVAHLSRYEIVAIQNGAGIGYAYKLDRWTGEVLFMARDISRPIEHQPATNSSR